MRACVGFPSLSRALCCCPAGIQAISRSYGKQADITTILGHKTDRIDCLRRNRAHERHNNFSIWTGLSKPVGAIDDALPQTIIDLALWLFDCSGREAKIN